MIPGPAHSQTGPLDIAVRTSSNDRCILAISTGSPNRLLRKKSGNEEMTASQLKAVSRRKGLEVQR